MVNVKAGIDKLDNEMLHIAPFAKDFTNVTFKALREILTAMDMPDDSGLGGCEIKSTRDILTELVTPDDKPSDVKTEHVCRSGGLGACPDCMKPYDVKTEQTLTPDDTLLVSTVSDMIPVAEERNVNYDDVAEKIIKHVRSHKSKDTVTISRKVAEEIFSVVDRWDSFRRGLIQMRICDDNLRNDTEKAVLKLKQALAKD